MITKEEYLLSPSGASSLPFWKSETYQTPQNMLVLRDDEYHRRAAELKAYRDERYFKLVHRLNGVRSPSLPQGCAFIDASDRDFSEHIRLCYGGGPNESEIAAYRAHFTCDPSLFIMLADGCGGAAASGIAGLDWRIGEGVLEWIQVSPAARRRGLGEFIVRELLSRLVGKADFVTVSGMLDDENRPLRMYEKCGFSEREIWHILTKER